MPEHHSEERLGDSFPDVLADRLAGGALTLKTATQFIESLTGLRPHYATLVRWMQSGRLPHYRVGGRVMTTKNAVRALLEADAQQRPRSRQRREVHDAGAAAAARIASGRGAA